MTLASGRHVHMKYWRSLFLTMNRLTTWEKETAVECVDVLQPCGGQRSLHSALTPWVQLPTFFQSVVQWVTISTRLFNLEFYLLYPDHKYYKYHKYIACPVQWFMMEILSGHVILLCVVDKLNLMVERMLWILPQLIILLNVPQSKFAACWSLHIYFILRGLRQSVFFCQGLFFSVTFPLLLLLFIIVITTYYYYYYFTVLQLG